jgi:hypothetical protein
MAKRPTVTKVPGSPPPPATPPRTTEQQQQQTGQPSSARPSSSLPRAGAFVNYDAVDPLTGATLAGVGVVIDAYTHGEGEDQVHRVNLSRLSADLNLAAADVKPLGSST